MRPSTRLRIRRNSNVVVRLVSARKRSVRGILDNESARTIMKIRGTKAGKTDVFGRQRTGPPEDPHSQELLAGNARFSFGRVPPGGTAGSPGDGRAGGWADPRLRDPAHAYRVGVCALPRHGGRGDQPRFRPFLSRDDLDCP